MSVKYIAFYLFMLAGVLHVLFFVMESLLFEKFASRFGIKKSEITLVKVWAFNQGFYNLFLAIAMFVGLSFVFSDNRIAGDRIIAAILVGYSGLSMLAAGCVLLCSAPHLKRAALLQILPPLLGFLFLYFHIT